MQKIQILIVLYNSTSACHLCSMFNIFYKIYFVYNCKEINSIRSFPLEKRVYYIVSI